MAVCEYCNTSVLKDADSIKDMGRMSAVLEDYSPIQINTSGVLGGRQFTVVGRIQLRYSAGMWNEWYLLFDDGSTGWLGDSSGQFVVTTARQGNGAPRSALPSFTSLAPGNFAMVDGRRYTVAEVRTAQCIGGQGELPFRVGEGWRAQVADLRDGGSFATLDYSDGEVPTVYTGVAVTLESMQCQLLRDDDDIRRTTGRHRGKLTALDCPSCGGPIKYLPCCAPRATRSSTPPARKCRCWRPASAWKPCGRRWNWAPAHAGTSRNCASRVSWCARTMKARAGTNT
jgi:hypothetical protein